jgi:hypothetical protein
MIASVCDSKAHHVRRFGRSAVPTPHIPVCTEFFPKQETGHFRKQIRGPCDYMEEYARRKPAPQFRTSLENRMAAHDGETVPRWIGSVIILPRLDKKKARRGGWPPGRCRPIVPWKLLCEAAVVRKRRTKLRARLMSKIGYVGLQRYFKWLRLTIRPE